MERVNFNPEWYGVQAKVLSRSERQMVVDYGCNGRGIVKNYSLFEGIQLCFLDFETDESMRAQKFNPDILQITHCQTGRYECEFANHTGGTFGQRAISALQPQRICRLRSLSPWGSITALVLS